MDFSVRSSKERTGKDAEFYVASSLDMLKNPDGHRRPDLLTRSTSYNPLLSIELKSGIRGKGVLVLGQLSYGLNRDEEYVAMLDEFKHLRPQLPLLDDNTNFLDPDVAMYYNVIERLDGLELSSFDSPYSAINCNWGDQHIVPHDFIFNFFVTSFAIRSKQKNFIPLRKKNQIKRLVAQYEAEGISFHNLNTILPNSNGWQTLESRLIRGLVRGDESEFSNKDMKVIETLDKIYDGFRNLVPIELEGPLGTSIYILSEPEHVDLFDWQMRESVQNNISNIEDIHEERQNLRKRISRFKPVKVGSNGSKRILTCANGNLPESISRSRLRLSPNEIEQLDLACTWGIGYDKIIN